MSTNARLLHLRWWLLGLIQRIPEPVLAWFGICPYCHRHSITVGKRQTRTAYHDERLNWEVSCIDCWEYHDDCWQGQWAEYHAGCL